MLFYVENSYNNVKECIMFCGDHAIYSNVNSVMDSLIEKLKMIAFI